MRIEAAADKIYGQSVRTAQEETGRNITYTENKKNVSKENDQIRNGTIFAGNLNLIEDPIAKRREEARKEAMGLISDQFQIDTDMDADIKKRNDHMDEVREESRRAGGEIDRLEKEMEKMKKEYGLEEGSGELIGIQKEIAHWREQQWESEKTVRSEAAAVRATRQAMLGREHDMSDVTAAAEDIMDAATEDIIGMLAKEAVDKMEEDRKEEQEQIEAAEEKKEEQEELIEDRREQEQVEELTKQAVKADSIVDQDEIKRKIQEILNEQKLLEDDLKGITVNSRT